MKEIRLKDGTLKCPTQWEILDGTLVSCEDATHAGIVEVKNGSRYNAPHIVILLDKPVDDISDGDLARIYSNVYTAFPQLSKIKEDYVQPKIENGVLVNFEEVKKSPCLGFFPIFASDDAIIKSGYKPPFGVVIEKGL